MRFFGPPRESRSRTGQFPREFIRTVRDDGVVDARDDFRVVHHRGPLSVAEMIACCERKRSEVTVVIDSQ